MNQYLFLFTIGPVQSFIAQARKTQDLYAGSFLLSYLTDYTMSELFKKTGACDFIFPHEKIKSKPNRFIAKIECEDPEEIGKYLEKLVRGKFLDICITISNDLNIDSPNFEKQINDFLDLGWVALPLENDTYADTFSKLESYMGAVKNVRHFQQLNEKGRKCSLCGERNELFYRGKKKAYVYDAISLDNLPLRHMAEGEGVCAVCLSKRFAEKYFNTKHVQGYPPYVKDYPSVAKISLMESLLKMDGAQLEKYENIFGDNFDEQLYFENNLTPKYFRKYGYQPEKLGASKSMLTHILEQAKDNEIKFPKYYAILSLDGDSMGEWLSGQNLANKSNMLNFHKGLTEKLGLFSEDVEKLIEKPKGKLVYAGGDDVLAFVNLNHLLPLIEELRTIFPRFEEISPVVNSKTSSASCGICIAHYKTPLSEALDWSRKMEKEAKSIDDGKNAFAIAALRRSGEIRKTVFKWQYENTNTIEVLIELIHLLKPKDSAAILDTPQLSGKFINSLNEEFKRLVDKEGRYEENLLFKTEMKRLIRRSLTLKKRPDEDKKDFNERKKNQISNLVDNLNILEENSTSLDNFLSLLDIAVFMERSMN